MPGNDSFTKLLIHADGADASTSFTDFSASAHTLTATGNAQVDTAQSKFGGGSLLLDGTGDYISVPDHADWNYDTGDFTIDFWIRWNALPSAGQFRDLYQQRVDASNVVEFNISNQAGTYRMQLFASSAGAAQANFTANLAGLSTGTWYHFAVERHGSNCNFYLDGVKQTTSTLTGFGTLPNVAAALRIGSGSDGEVNGWMDEVRVSKGVARYAGTGFTPETVAYGQQLTLTSEAGAFTLTGQAALKKISMASAAGAFTLAGMDALLTYGYKLIAAAGSFTVTGVAALLLRVIQAYPYAKRRFAASRLFKRRSTDPRLTE